jgi:ribosomal peptide maturation radical SAM protein 1
MSAYPGRTSVDVAFVVMPFADVDRPAIGVSLLQAAAKGVGLSSKILYCNFDLAEAIEYELYRALSDLVPTESLVGEWFFADIVFDLPPEQEYITKVLSKNAPPAMISKVLEARKLRRRFIEQCTQFVLQANPRVVGFTTTFHQSCASLAVAKRLKECGSPAPIVFGGANCEGEMGEEFLRSFSFIDYVCTREGDIAFPDFLARFFRQGDRRGGPGFIGRCDEVPNEPPKLVVDLDALPIPDYGDYFQRIESSTLRDILRPTILVETSRGCWWGAKHHCTFCGLNGETMHFRSKSPARAVEEITTLSSRHGVKRVDFVDNILDMRYFSTMIPMLEDAHLELEMFYEVKANLRHDQVAALARVGVKRIQPGIESFSDEVLALMRKGCTACQNIQLLRWCLECGVQPLWNLIGGFPGESPDEYEAAAQLVPLLVHLPPPSGCAPIRLDRFSPLFTRASETGLRQVRPNAAYYYVYPFGRRVLSRLAYFFNFEYPDGRNPDAYLDPLTRATEDWKAAHSRPAGRAPILDATWVAPVEWHIADTRNCAKKCEYRLRGVAARVYTACDRAQTRSTLQRLLSDADADELDSAIAELIEDKLLLSKNGQLLSLAVMRLRPGSSEESNGQVTAATANAAAQLSCAV